MDSIIRWVYLTNMTSPSGKILYACTRCGCVSPAPTKYHVCSEGDLEMNEPKYGTPFPTSAFQS